MNAPCLRDLATHLGVPPADLVDALRGRFELVLEAASGVHRLTGLDALTVHNDLDAVTGFVAAVRVDLPVAYLPVTGPMAATARPETRSLERSVL